MIEDLQKALFRILPNVVALLVIAVLVKRKKINPTEVALQKPTNLKQAWGLFCLFCLYILLIEILSYKLGFLIISPWNHGPYSTVIRFIGAIIIAPVAEELLYRGLVLSFLFKKTNVHRSILIQAIFFVVSHGYIYSTNASALFYTGIGLIDALIYGYTRHYTRSIYPGMAMHAFGNTIALLERFFFA